MQTPLSFVLWSQTPQRLVSPVVLVSAAHPEDCQKWREQNRWSGTIPLVLFGGETLLPLGRTFMPPSDPPDGVPWRVENAPDGVWEGLLPWSTPGQFGARLDRYSSFARHVARHLPAGPVWCINADADGGVLAVAMAAARGRCFAHAATPPSALAVSFAQRFDVSLSVRDTTTKIESDA